MNESKHTPGPMGFPDLEYPEDSLPPKICECNTDLEWREDMGRWWCPICNYSEPDELTSAEEEAIERFADETDDRDCGDK